MVNSRLSSHRFDRSKMSSLEFIISRSHLSGFNWGHNCSWRWNLTSANSMQVSNKHPFSHNKPSQRQGVGLLQATSLKWSNQVPAHNRICFLYLNISKKSSKGIYRSRKVHWNSLTNQCPIL